jgi:ABC-type proline/glycine betaine transport system permease subunit
MLGFSRRDAVVLAIGVLVVAELVASMVYGVIIYATAINPNDPLVLRGS